MARTIQEIAGVEWNDLPPYGAILYCPKCGEVRLYRGKYCPGATPRRSCWGLVGPYAGDHMHVTCHACEFGWFEWCKDREEGGDED
jgi:hypothetical protein